MRPAFTLALRFWPASFALCAFPLCAFADESAVIDLTGVKLKNASNQYRDSSPQTIDDAFGYRYQLDAMVKGESGLLQILYPSPTPLADVLETLLPGSSEALNGEVYNPSGAHPLELTNERFEGDGNIGGINVHVGVTVGVGINAADVAWFSFTDVVIDPALIVGSMVVTSGTATLERIPAATADMNWDGSVNAFDISPFVLALSDPNAYTSTYGYSPIYPGDVDRDGSLNAQDIQPFIDALWNP